MNQSGLSADHPDLIAAIEAVLAPLDADSHQSVSIRELAKTCLKVILSKGFEIRAIDAATGDLAQGKEVADLVEQLTKEKKISLRELMHLWRKISIGDSSGSVELYANIGERVLRSGEPLMAYDILHAGVKKWPDNVQLRQLLALALARSGAPRRAAEWLKGLISEGHNDGETLGLLARTSKDQWELESDPAGKINYLTDAKNLYQQGFEHADARGVVDDALYAGINAATMAFLLNETEAAETIAQRVRVICQNKTDLLTDYWALATLGECALIAKQFECAAEHYRGAVTIAGNRYADIASTRRNAAILLKHIGENLELLDDWFPIPRVAVFTGHLMDRPDSPRRFPHERIDAVGARIHQIIEQERIEFGYSAAACGGDLLFIEALREQGAESYIVLPLSPERFVEASVAVDPKRDWRSEFDNALEAAARVSVINDFSQSAEPMHFEYSNQVMTGLAMLHSHTLGAEIVPIAVWDGKPARALGGTGSLVDQWKSLGWQPRIIHPLESAEPTDPVIANLETDVPDRRASNTHQQDIRAMLFADVVGYSKITEEEIPLFVNEFMGSIAKVVRESGIQVESENTWGDAIYFVFRCVEEAGLTALLITEHVNSIDWKSRGFSRQLNLRTGLHVGPVFRFVDPVTKIATHTGSHVSRAARIEPITPPGEVYASEAFAAVAAVEKVKSFQSEYVGVTPMAKGYGDFATYHVRRCSF